VPNASEYPHSSRQEQEADRELLNAMETHHVVTGGQITVKVYLMSGPPKALQVLILIK
jgi:hypothetical protein